MRNTFVANCLILLVLSTSVAPLVGCASSTTISSEPMGAAVKIDGQPVGNTPVSYTNESVYVWTEHQVTLEKKGYHPYNGQVEATFSVMHLLIGIFCCLPFVIVGEFKPTYHFVLAQQATAQLMQEWVEDAVVQFSE